MGWCVRMNFLMKQSWESSRDKYNKIIWGGLLLWTETIIPCCSFTTWVAVKSKLPTLARIKSWGIPLANRCILCKQSEEHIDNLFFNYRFSFHLWIVLNHGVWGYTNIKTWDKWLIWAFTNLRNKRYKKKWGSYTQRRMIQFGVKNRRPIFGHSNKSFMSIHQQMVFAIFLEVHTF